MDNSTLYLYILVVLVYFTYAILDAEGTVVLH